MTKKSLLKLSVAASVLMTAACGNADTDNNANTNDAPAAVADAAKPELGSFGIDLTAQDAAVKPGDDFNMFANGTWAANFEIPKEFSSYGAFTVLFERSEDRIKAIIDELAANESSAGSLEQKVGDYYNSYMDVAKANELGIDPIRDDIAAIDGISNTADLTVMLGRAGELALSSPIFGYIGNDRQNPDRFQVNVGFGGLGLPDRDYYLEDNERFNKIRDAYKGHIAQMLGFADIADADAKADAIIALETKLAENQWKRADRRDRDKTYNPTSYDDFKAKFTDFDWDAFFKANGIETIEDLNVVHPEPIMAAIDIVKDTPLETWKAYLTYHLISNRAGVLSEEIDNANFEFFGKTLRGQPEQRERWKRGVARVGGTNSLGFALAKIYVDRHFPPEAKAEMTDLVENLRTALGQRIDGLDWMGDETKVEARKKLASFFPKIGYPDVWRDLSGIEIVAGDLVGNAKRVAKFFRDDQLAKYNAGEKTDRTRWGMTPQTVNAYYNPSFNEIVFPAAILQAPFFDLAADPAVNYGGIGAVIGHEMGHGFDDQGSKSDFAGIQRNWWTDEDRKNFDAKTKALASQYDKYEPVEGTFVDGTFTLGENIGDLGGLSMAYHAYKLSLNGKEAPVIDGLTGDQRFFLAWAQVWKSKTRDAALVARMKSDPHAPNQYRINGVVRNMQEWYDAFGVTEGDALYLPPEERVSIW
jgi:putative endopeptidase